MEHQLVSCLTSLTRLYQLCGTLFAKVDTSPAPDFLCNDKSMQCKFPDMFLFLSDVTQAATRQAEQFARILSTCIDGGRA